MQGQGVQGAGCSAVRSAQCPLCSLQCVSRPPPPSRLQMLEQLRDERPPEAIRASDSHAERKQDLKRKYAACNSRCATALQPCARVHARAHNMRITVQPKTLVLC